jgi:serine O-acetyltransferase
MSRIVESRHTRHLSLSALVREDYVRHGCDWTRPGFRAMAVYRFGVWRMRIGSRLLRAPLSFLYRRLFIRVRNRYGIELPFSAQLGRRVTLEHSHSIVIHGNSVIGNDCYIRQGCTLGNKSLDAPFDAPILGDRVNVGAGAKLLGRVIVGDDATIGANAVVVRHVPAGAVAMGIPAQILRPVPRTSASRGGGSSRSWPAHVADAGPLPRGNGASPAAPGAHLD